LVRKTQGWGWEMWVAVMVALADLLPCAKGRARNWLEAPCQSVSADSCWSNAAACWSLQFAY